MAGNTGGEHVGEHAGIDGGPPTLTEPDRLTARHFRTTIAE
nr:hypothetical protein [Nocardia brasiliensis]